MRDPEQAEGNTWSVEGWLTDGSFTSIVYYHDLRASDATVEFSFVPGEIPLSPGDTNYDDVIDIQDLNNVRNNFAGSGLGDSNQDGIVNVEDLNLVRNNFGENGLFFLGPEYEVPRPGNVPEPGSWFLLITALSGCFVRRTGRIEWSCWRATRSTSTTNRSSGSDSPPTY